DPPFAPPGSAGVGRGPPRRAPRPAPPRRSYPDAPGRAGCRRTAGYRRSAAGGRWSTTRPSRRSGSRCPLHDDRVVTATPTARHRLHPLLEDRLLVDAAAPAEVEVVEPPRSG